MIFVFTVGGPFVSGVCAPSFTRFHPFNSKVNISVNCPNIVKRYVPVRYTIYNIKQCKVPSLTNVKQCKVPSDGIVSH